MAAAGGELRAVLVSEGIHFDFRPRRVTVVTDDARARVLPELG